MTPVRGVTAEQAAKAIVTAAMLLGVDPGKAFQGGRAKGRIGGLAVRILAAHGVRARLGVAPVILGRIFAVHPNDVAPSAARRRGITTDQLLAIAEAIGPVETDDARGRFLEPMSGVPVRPCPTPDTRHPTPDTRHPTPDTRHPTPGVCGMSAGGKALLAERPRAVRYATWFLEAGWRLKSVAGLFDLNDRDLLDALDPEGAS